MKGLTDCSGVYRTPWCDMLFGDGCCGISRNVLHLWYKLEWLQKEIEKRSSYLGKFRKTEEAKHLLDLISMTKDEEDLFYPFAKAAMADVLDALMRFMPKEKHCYLWREGRETITINDLPKFDFLGNGGGYDIQLYSQQSIQGEIGFTPQGIDFTQVGATALLRLTYTVGFIIKATNTEIIEQRQINLMQEFDKLDKSNNWIATIDYSPELAPEQAETSAEYIKSLDAYKVVSGIYYYRNPIIFHGGDYVEWNGQLYLAIMGGNANYPSECLVPTPDYRDSIHYLIGYPMDKSITLAGAIDTAVFEALVARIIFKWLEYAYPDEAERYLTAYNEELEKIRRRCLILTGGQIVNRIPRLL